MRHSDLQPERRYGEDHEAYRKRRRAAEQRVRHYLHPRLGGTLVWTSVFLHPVTRVRVKMQGTYRKPKA